MAGQNFSKPVGQPFHQMSPVVPDPAPIPLIIPFNNNPVPVPHGPPMLHISLDAQPPEYPNPGDEGGRQMAADYNAGRYDAVTIAPGPGEFFCRNREDFLRQLEEGKIPGMGPNAPIYPQRNLPQVSPNPMPTFDPWAARKKKKKKKGKKHPTRRSSCNGMPLRSQRRQDKDDDEKDKYRVSNHSSRIPIINAT